MAVRTLTADEIEAVASAAEQRMTLPKTTLSRNGTQMNGETKEARAQGRTADRSTTNLHSLELIFTVPRAWQRHLSEWYLISQLEA